MDFRQIEAFVNVVKYRSFSKAADALFLTQPTISVHVNSLEKELNTSLLNRKGREVVPTAAGDIFYKYAKDMMNIREQAIASLKQYGSCMAGVLEIQTSSIPGQYILPKLISEFSAEYPKIKYFMEQTDTDQVVENVLNSKGEIGFIGRKASEKNLEYTLLYRDKPVVITPKTEKFAALERNARLEEFINEPFIQRAQGSATLKIFEDAVEKVVPGNKLNIIARLNNLEAVKQAVAEGLGISVISGMAIPETDYDVRYLVFRPENLKQSREFYMVYDRKAAMSPVAAAFKDFILQRRNLDEEYIL